MPNAIDTLLQAAKEQSSETTDLLYEFAFQHGYDAESTALLKVLQSQHHTISKLITAIAEIAQRA